MARSSTSTSTRARSTSSTAGKRATKRAAPARRATSAARRTSGSTAAGSRPKQQAQQLTEQARERTRSSIRDQLGERSQQAGDQLSGTAADVRAIAAQLRSQDNDPAARLADLAADKVNQVGDYLSKSDPDRLLSDVEDFARSKPWLTAGVAAAVGFVAARGLSSSSRRRRGGPLVRSEAGSDFDEADAAAAYSNGTSRSSR